MFRRVLTEGQEKMMKMTTLVGILFGTFLLLPQYSAAQSGQAQQAGAISATGVVVNGVILFDLKLDDIDATDGIYLPGDMIPIDITIENIGSEDSPGFTVTYYASEGTIITPSDFELGSSMHVAIEHGEFIMHSFEGVFPDDIPDDDYYIGAIIEVDDPDNENNLGFDQGTVLIDANPDAELVLNEVDALGSTFAQGTSFTIDTIVENIGTAASGPFPIDFYLSLNDGISTSDILIGTDMRASIAAGEISNKSFVAMIPSDLEPGIYFVGAIIEIFHEDGSNNDENDDDPIRVVEPGGTIFDINVGHNGNWWNGPGRSGEGVQFELVQGPDGTVTLIATVYSYDTDGNQIFLISLGSVIGDTAEIDVYITEGGLWGDDFDFTLVNETQWGTGRIISTGCETMRLELRPNATYRAMGYTDLIYDLIRLAVPIAPCPAVEAN
jgi:hypothetical protein